MTEPVTPAPGGPETPELEDLQQIVHDLSRLVGDDDLDGVLGYEVRAVLRAGLRATWRAQRAEAALASRGSARPAATPTEGERWSFARRCVDAGYYLSDDVPRNSGFELISAAIDAKAAQLDAGDAEPGEGARTPDAEELMRTVPATKIVDLMVALKESLAKEPSESSRRSPEPK